MKEIKEGEEVVEMCKKEEEFGNRRYNKGKEEGRAEGDEHRARMVTINCLEMNYSLQKIARIVGRSIDVVESWAKESGLSYQVNWEKQDCLQINVGSLFQVKDITEICVLSG